VRILDRISEDDMIAVFLRGELQSDRFGATLRDLLRENGRDEGVLLRPEARDNDFRRQLLDAHRAYGRREGLFFGFPDGVEWHRAVLDREEVLDVRYINWDWWLTVSGGTRSPREAARRIRAGEVAGVDASAAAFESDDPPELIVVTTSELSPLVLLEGHGRLTAYAVFPDRLPNELEILLGISAEMAQWSEF
jgi:hypothetical protein